MFRGNHAVVLNEPGWFFFKCWSSPIALSVTSGALSVEKSFFLFSSAHTSLRSCSIAARVFSYETLLDSCEEKLYLAVSSTYFYYIEIHCVFKKNKVFNKALKMFQSVLNFVIVYISNIFADLHLTFLCERIIPTNKFSSFAVLENILFTFTNVCYRSPTPPGYLWLN